MPCVVDDSFERASEARNHARIEAMLCGLLKQLEAYPDFMNFLIDSVSEEEQGISGHSIRSWWEGHKRADLARIARERKDALDELDKVEFQKKRLEERVKALYGNAL